MKLDLLLSIVAVLSNPVRPVVIPVLLYKILDKTTVFVLINTSILVVIKVIDLIAVVIVTGCLALRCVLSRAIDLNWSFFCVICLSVRLFYLIFYYVLTYIILLLWLQEYRYSDLNPSNYRLSFREDMQPSWIPGKWRYVLQRFVLLRLSVFLYMWPRLQFGRRKITEMHGRRMEFWSAHLQTFVENHFSSLLVVTIGHNFIQ